MANSVPLRIVQISDIHLFADKEKSLLGVNTHESLAAVIKHLEADKEKADLIILSGDLSQDGSEASYMRLVDMLKVFSVPIYYVPGNHDDAMQMATLYPRGNITHHRHIVLKHWHIILLDSHKHGSVEGYLDQTQLNFMQHCLQMYPEHYAVVVFHHQPIPVGSAWVDKLGLTNADELWQVLKNFPKMHTILFGHVHQEHEGKKNGVHYFAAPSTCIQFGRNSSEFKLENLAQGYRWIELYADGTLKTGIERVSEYVGTFDVNAIGY